MTNVLALRENILKKKNNTIVFIPLPLHSANFMTFPGISWGTKHSTRARGHIDTIKLPLLITQGTEEIYRRKRG
jgi:hypothetical protein